MRFVWKFHKWYDSLQEYWQLLIILVVFGGTWDIAFGIIPNLYIMTVGQAGLLLLCLLTVTRIYYVDFRNHKSKS